MTANAAPAAQVQERRSPSGTEALELPWQPSNRPGSSVSPSFVHRITKFDPANRDERGHYTGTEDAVSDHGPVEAAYLEAVGAFAKASGVDRLEIREPGVTGPVHFGVEPATGGHGLAGLLPPDLSGYYDGAEVSLSVALELVRAMLREQGAWCRLEAGDTFTVHVGWDQYVYVGSDRPCPDAVERTRRLGLFPEPLSASPYAVDSDDLEVMEAANEDFWMRVRTTLASLQTVLLEETYLRNATRWHRITTENLDVVRADLGPRALLTVWPDLTPDVGAVLAALPPEDSVEFVWESQDGTIAHALVDDTDYPQLAALVADARAAGILPLTLDERRPLLSAALPDGDGVLRARW
ncbi:RNA-binding protein [Streptomyces sp. NPDC054864]